MGGSPLYVELFSTSSYKMGNAATAINDDQWLFAWNIYYDGINKSNMFVIMFMVLFKYEVLEELFQA